MQAIKTNIFNFVQFKKDITLGMRSIKELYKLFCLVD